MGMLYTNIACLSDIMLRQQDSGFIFGLDMQLLVDVLIQGVSIFILFAFLSFILFEPVKKLLAQRQERIKNDIEQAKKDKEASATMKAEYEERLKKVDKEVEEILSSARKKAKKRENEIIGEAQEEAARILARANQEIELEKAKVKDEMRKEIINVATAMASKLVAESIDSSKQDALIDETLKEMGEDTWLSR